MSYYHPPPQGHTYGPSYGAPYQEPPPPTFNSGHPGPHPHTYDPPVNGPGGYYAPNYYGGPQHGGWQEYPPRGYPAGYHGRGRHHHSPRPDDGRDPGPRRRGPPKAPNPASGNPKDERDAVSWLQRYAQAVRWELPLYAEQGRMGDAHDPTFTYMVTVGPYSSTAMGANKKLAKQNAARGVIPSPNKKLTVGEPASSELLRIPGGCPRFEWPGSRRVG
mmetsp:Transcript_54126/g.123328  ORF Transcript_54126/g.123328 Transcript_54126/m.123328 type:complete len:218 (-) Transcript_54126:1189-1842(-)